MKKLSILIALLCLCLSLAACKKPAEQPDNTTAPTSGKVNVEMDIQGADFVSYAYTDQIYRGVMKVKVTCSVDGEFTATSKYFDPATVSLKAGENTVALPCRMESLTVSGVFLTFTKVDTGEIFDKMCKLKATTEIIDVNMTLPGYRDSFYPGQDYSKVSGKLAVEKKVTVKLEGPGIEAQVVTTDANGNFTFETPNFEIGEATLSLVIDGCDIATKTICRLADTGKTMTWIENGVPVINGEPVLRRSIYAPEYRVSEYDKQKMYADNLYQTEGFVAFVAMNYAIFHDRDTEHRRDAPPSPEVLKRIDSYINSKENFGFYYLADEAGWKKTSAVYLKYIYDYIKEKDPYHVIIMGDPYEYHEKYFECCDWMETGVYMSPRATEDGRVFLRQMSEFGPLIDGTPFVNLNRPDKCFGVLPQVYRGAASGYPDITDWDYPTFDEILGSTWTGLAHGAKSVWPYAGHDVHDRPRLYEGVRYVFSSIEALEDLLLFGEREMLKRTDTMEAVLWTKGNEKLLVVINLTQETQSVTVEGLSGTWYNFRHEGTFSGNEFELEPLEVLIGTSSIKDTDLPSYDETVALIEELELERISGGSLLFNRYDDIPITNSSTVMLATLRKLFDGVQTNHACLIKGTGEKFLELDLTNVKPTFNKVVVSGWHVDEMEIKIYINGELVALEIEEVQKEEYSTTFILKEAVSPDALRLEFHQDRLEVYEVEVFNDVE